MSDRESFSLEDRSWQRHLTLPGLLALGFLVFEATSQPALGIVVVCVKFGWNDLLTAYWLRMRDPVAGRGRTCFWLYLNSGFLKIGGSAFGFCLLLAIIQSLVDAKNPAPVKGKNEAALVINHTAVLGMAAFALGSLFALPTLWWAWRTGTKLWLDSALHRARRLDHWPPSRTDSNGKNRAKIVLPASFIILILPTTLWALDSWALNHRNAALWISASLVFIPGIILGLSGPLFGWALAKNPGECWVASGQVENEFVGQDSNPDAPGMAGSESCPTELRTSDIGQ
jgi:hypothetical protein